MKYLYLFFDQHAPRPELHDAPLGRDAALLMGIYPSEAEAQERLQALRRQITEAVDYVRPAAKRLRSDLLDAVERRTRRSQPR